MRCSRPTARTVRLGALLAAALVCSPSRAEEQRPSAASAAAETASALPVGLTPGVVSSLKVPGDKSVLVIHAPADNTRAIVYLHGYCGNIFAIEDFKQAAAEIGTLIALRADHGCGGGRYRWSTHLGLIQTRIRRALSAVKKARGGQLNPKDVVLFGYSQGAARAERLAAQFPKTYPRVVLGGPPRKPKVSSFRRTQVVAVFGGADEETEHMQQGVRDLVDHGRSSRFFVLPAAKHGEYGPQGNQVIHEVLSWVVSTDEKN